MLRSAQNSPQESAIKFKFPLIAIELSLEYGEKREHLNLVCKRASNKNADTHELSRLCKVAWQQSCLPPFIESMELGPSEANPCSRSLPSLIRTAIHRTWWRHRRCPIESWPYYWQTEEEAWKEEHKGKWRDAEVRKGKGQRVKSEARDMRRIERDPLCRAVCVLDQRHI